MLLFDGKTGALLALMQADYLGQMRTGAASGVATQYMARPDATEVGLFGSGKQARTQIAGGVQGAARFAGCTVYSPNEEHRTAFAAEMSTLCQTEVEPVARPEQAAEDKDIIITATDSREPVLLRPLDRPGHAHQRHRLELSASRPSWTPPPMRTCDRHRGR